MAQGTFPFQFDTRANIHMYVDIYLFSSYQVRRKFLLVDVEWSTCNGSWYLYGRSKSYFGKDHATKKHVAYPLNKEKLSYLFLSQDGYKVMFKTNKFMLRMKILLVKNMRAKTCSACLHLILVLNV
jgi:hypothetical protein